MAAPPIIERHLPHFHRRAPIKELVRAATTAPITIATALNNGDTLDGVTLATDDRVLVKDQSTGAENGIYVVGASPARAYDASTDDPTFGYLVLVLQGTANAGTLWQNTNTSAPTIGSTTLTYSQFTGGAPSFATPAIVLGSSAAAGAASTVIRSDSTIAAFDATNPVTLAFGASASVGSAAFAAHRDHGHAMPTAAVTTSGLTQATGKLLGRSSASTGAIEEITVGANLTLSGGTLDATTAGSATITTEDEGSTLSTTVDTLNFTGAGVSASGGSNITTINIPGTTGAGAVQYPGLKPGSPTYDFDGTSLPGAFAAYSTQGSFVTGNAITQGVHWMGSSVEMEYSAQMGGLYVTHGNTDLDFSVGGMGVHGNPGSAIMIGIAALNSSGTGVGITAYTDTNCYFCSVVTYGYTANSDNWGGYGLANGDSQGDYWMRLTRVSGTWTGYVSRSGRAWDKTFSTRADSVTVDRLVFGILFLTATAYNVRVWADYFHVAV
jgi:hypothetical protein